MCSIIFTLFNRVSNAAEVYYYIQYLCKNFIYCRLEIKDFKFLLRYINFDPSFMKIYYNFNVDKKNIFPKKTIKNL